MNSSEDDPRSISSIAEEIIRDSRQIPFHASLDVIYDVGSAIAM